MTRKLSAQLPHASMLKRSVNDAVGISPAIGLALVENGYRVLYTRTTDLVQKLQQAGDRVARPDLRQ